MHSWLLLSALVLLLDACVAVERPIIGILAHEVKAQRTKQLYPNVTSYIASSYVKAVEGSGARVVPILLGKDVEYYMNLMKYINGILFPGGDAEFNDPKGYGEAGSIVYKEAVKMNDKGDHMPLLGICLGFEFLMHLANKGKELMADCESNRVSLALKFKPDFQESRLLKDADPTILQILSTQPVTSNHHSYCVTEKNFTKFGLDKEWRLISTNEDKNGLEFISTVESKRHPIAGVQFHPEKNAYEWKLDQNNPHTPDAIYSARHFFDWLVKEARESNHSFPKDKPELEYEYSIHQYTPAYTGALNMSFEQMYLF